MGIPRFGDPHDVVASGITEKAALMHEVRLSDELTNPGTTDHVPLQPGQDLFFVVLAWDGLGNWDAVWNTEATLSPTGTPAPEGIRTKSRAVDVRIRKLTCLDDSDDFSYGEATFTLRVKHAGESHKTYSWKPMSTDSSAVFNPKEPMSVSVAAPNANGSVSVRLEGVEDDSGSFPPDSDDEASPQGSTGYQTLRFPVGEVSEQGQQVLVWTSKPITGGEVLEYQAEVVVDYSYS